MKTPITASKQIQAVVRRVPMSAQKLRLVADQIRSLGIEEARTRMQLSNKKGALYLAKALDSAISNAEHNHGVEDFHNYRICTLMVDEGATLKRGRFRARGRGSRILKRTCHITLRIQEA
ncbi:MAG: 50S ribosomal protein L22 [Gammaproteobacteria bacterium AqS3]|nr:50S ribosomal protein L22 [Gammaproteobacteria bacterium AqS3]